MKQVSDNSRLLESSAPRCLSQELVLQIANEPLTSLNVGILFVVLETELVVRD